MFQRLGIETGEMAEDMRLVIAIETSLARRTVEIDRFFFDWRGGGLRGGRLAAAAYETDDFADFRGEIARRRARRRRARSCLLVGRGGLLDAAIEEVEAIWSAIDERDDWAPLQAKIAAVRRMGEAKARAPERGPSVRSALEKSLAPAMTGPMAKTLTSIEPATGETLPTGAAGDPEAEEAAARAAWPAWAAQPLAFRVETPRRFANIVRAKLEPFADLIARETGKPLWKPGPRSRR